MPSKERMYIQELKQELPYHNVRSIVRFCQNHDIRLFSFTGSKVKFVLRDQFERQMEKIYSSEPLAKDLKVINKIGRNRNYKTKRRSPYKPQGQYEKEVLSRLANL